MMPSESAPTMACRSLSLRRGGDIFACVSEGSTGGASSCRKAGTEAGTPATASSVSVKWCGVASAVTRTPRAFASRMARTVPAALTWATCRWAPVISARSRSRCTMATSAAAGIPGSPSRVATAPSFMQPGPVSVRSSACTMTGRPRSCAYSKARRITPADITGRPSSVRQTHPASLSSAMSLSDSPRDPRVMAPAGSTRANPASRARACTNLATEALSQTGRVFGMAMTVVTPPAAAARVPEAMVSFPSSPGSRRCTCRSTNPGRTRRPRQSTTSLTARSPDDTPCSRTSLILPPSMTTVRTPSTRVAGSTTLPPSRKITGHSPGQPDYTAENAFRWRGKLSCSTQAERQSGHADRDAAVHLVHHQAALAVHHLAGQLHPPVHRAGVQDHGPGRQELQRARVETPHAGIVARSGDARIRNALLLDAQHHHRVRIAQRVRQRAGDLAAQLLHPGWDERAGAGDAHPRAQLGEAVDVGPSNAAVGDVAHDGDHLARELAQLLPQSERVEQRLGGVLVRAVARVDHARPHGPGDRPRRSGGGVAHHQDVRADGLQVAHRVLQGLALGHAGGVLLEAEHLGPQGVGRDLEGAPGAGGSLEEEGHHGPAGEQIVAGHAALPRPRRRALALEARRQLEHLFDLLAPQGFDVEEVARELRRHGAAAARNGARGPPRGSSGPSSRRRRRRAGTRPPSPRRPRCRSRPAGRSRAAARSCRCCTGTCSRPRSAGARRTRP